MILKGVTIGDNVFICANSVVSRDIPSNSIAVGSPAHVVHTLDDYYKRRKEEKKNVFRRHWTMREVLKKGMADSLYQQIFGKNFR